VSEPMFAYEAPRETRAVLLPGRDKESTGLTTAAGRERVEGAMHQACSVKRMEPWSVPQAYCIAPERRFRSACQPALGSIAPEE